MTKYSFNNDSIPAKRARVLKSERNASTYSQFATADDIGGRYKNQTRRMTVGEKPTIDYPAGAAWTRDRLPDELPLGVDINAQEPVGERHEIGEAGSPHLTRKSRKRR